MEGNRPHLSHAGQHAPAHQGRRPGEVSTKIKMIGQHVRSRAGFALPGHRIFPACRYGP
jgi:hypothetical protein